MPSQQPDPLADLSDDDIAEALLNSVTPTITRRWARAVPTIFVCTLLIVVVATLVVANMAAPGLVSSILNAGLGLFALIFGLFFAWFGVRFNLIRFRLWRRGVPILASCVGRKTMAVYHGDSGSEMHLVYRGVFEYTYDGQRYQSVDTLYQERSFEIGEKHTVYHLPGSNQPGRRIEYSVLIPCLCFLLALLSLPFGVHLINKSVTEFEKYHQREAQRPNASSSHLSSIVASRVERSPPKAYGSRPNEYPNFRPRAITQRNSCQNGV